MPPHPRSPPPCLQVCLKLLPELGPDAVVFSSTTPERCVGVCWKNPAALALSVLGRGFLMPPGLIIREDC